MFVCVFVCVRARTGGREGALALISLACKVLGAQIAAHDACSMVDTWCEHCDTMLRAVDTMHKAV